MEYKVLVTILVPEIEKNYEVYLPVNRAIGDVCKLINKLVNEDTYGLFPIRDDVLLCNRHTGEFYSYQSYIRDTNIRNGSQLVYF